MERAFGYRWVAGISGLFYLECDGEWVASAWLSSVSGWVWGTVDGLNHYGYASLDAAKSAAVAYIGSL